MEKVSELIGVIKKNNYARILIELVIGTLLFNFNSIMGIVFVAIIALEIAFATVEDSLSIYLFLSFFDEVLQNKYLGGSISRIIMVIIALKLSVNIIKNKIKPNSREIAIGIFFMFSFIVGIITYKTISIDVLIILFNIFIFILFSMNIKVKSKEDIEEFIEKLLFTIVVAVLNSIVYGVITNSFLKEIDGQNIVYRFKGTYEPNFMCMFINLGIISILALKGKRINKNVANILCVLMIIANIMTVSITGLATLFFTIVLYFVINRKNLKEEIRDISVIALITVIIFSIMQMSNNTIKKIEQEKIENKKTTEITKENTTVKESFEDKTDEVNVIEENIETIDVETVQKENDANTKIISNEQSQEILVEKEEEKELNSNLGKRLEFLLETLTNGDLARFTSGRIPLMGTFISASFNRPIGNILFGNDATTKKLFSNYFYGEKYSHNSYMDILYNFGIIGFIIVLTYILKTTHKNIYLKNSLDNNYYKNTIKLIRIMLLIYAFSLSLYTKRMFLIFFLL